MLCLEERLAQSMFDEMPERAVDVITENMIKPGTQLVKVASDLMKANAKDSMDRRCPAVCACNLEFCLQEVSENFVWLRRICVEYPRKVHHHVA